MKEQNTNNTKDNAELSLDELEAVNGGMMNHPAISSRQVISADGLETGTDTDKDDNEQAGPNASTFVPGLQFKKGKKKSLMQEFRRFVKK